MSAGNATVQRVWHDGSGVADVDTYTFSSDGSAYVAKAKARAQAESVNDSIADVTVTMTDEFGEPAETPTARYRNGVLVETTPGEVMSDEGGPAERRADATTKAPVMLTDAWTLAHSVAREADDDATCDESGLAHAAIVADRLEIRRALRDMKAELQGLNRKNASDVWAHGISTLNIAAEKMFGADWETGL